MLSPTSSTSEGSCSSHQTECVKHKARLKGRDMCTRVLEFPLISFVHHKKTKSLHFSPNPGPESIPTVPYLHDPDLPTLARSGQVVCRDPAASSGSSLHKPRHKEPTQRTAFEEHRKKQSVRFAPPTEPGGLCWSREGKINTAI